MKQERKSAEGLGIFRVLGLSSGRAVCKVSDALRPPRTSGFKSLVPCLSAGYFSPPASLFRSALNSCPSLPLPPPTPLSPLVSPGLPSPAVTSALLCVRPVVCCMDDYSVNELRAGSPGRSYAFKLTLRMFGEAAEGDPGDCGGRREADAEPIGSPAQAQATKVLMTIVDGCTPPLARIIIQHWA